MSIVCIENEHLRELLPSIHRRVITYGLNRNAELYAANIKKSFMSVSFTVIYKGENIGDFDLPAPGIHNILNSLAAIGVALVLKLDAPIIKDALKGFSGIQRRFEFKGEVNGIKVFDDYGHHPSEIRATLKAAREGLLNSGGQGGRLFVLFQPHRYTRTKYLMDDFTSSFSDADSLVLLDIYPAGEKPIEGVNSETLFKRIKKAGYGSVQYSADREDAIGHIISNIGKGDILLTLGAGNVWKMGDEILKRLRVRND
jgi:UDP-N-acetylmuramate--alanine ligase